MSEENTEKGNIITFPKTKKGSPPVTIEEIKHNIEEARRYKIEIDLDDFKEYCLEYFNALNMDILDENNIKSYAIFCEAAAALFYKCSGYDHPFQIVADTIIQIKSEEDEKNKE